MSDYKIVKLEEKDAEGHTRFGVARVADGEIVDRSNGRGYKSPRSAWLGWYGFKQRYRERQEARR